MPTFDFIEKLKRNKPILFFDFYRGGKHWRKTSADVDIVYLGDTYESTAVIEMSEVNVSGDLAQAYVNIKLAATDDFVRANGGFPSGAQTRVRVYMQHRGEDDTIPILDYRLVNWRYRKALCELRFESNTTRNREQSLRRTATPQCSHLLYDQTPFTCLVQKENFRTNSSVTMLGPRLFNAPAASAKPTGYFNGGQLNWLSPDGLTESRSIDLHEGSNITIRAVILGLASGATVALYPGCNHAPGLSGDCHAKFDNYPNYGGLPHVPLKDPYDGNPNVY